LPMPTIFGGRTALVSYHAHRENDTKDDRTNETNDRVIIPAKLAELCDRSFCHTTNDHITPPALPE